MPVGIIKPSNQIKHTNISVVRMKKGKKRFEIACYKNKVMDWRSRVETELDNVLQIPQVYLSISKGQIAPKADLTKAWPGKSDDEIVKDILQNGDLQVGEKERNAQLERVRNEVIDIIAGKLVDPKTNRVYTPGMIEKALDQLSSQSAHHQKDKAEESTAENGEEKTEEKRLPKWTGIVANKEAKPQALAAIKALVAHQPIPVMRARMRLRIVCPVSVSKFTVKNPRAQTAADAGDSEQKTEKSKAVVKDIVSSYFDQIESQEVTGDEWEIFGFVDPGAFKPLGEFVGSQTKGQGRLEVLDTAIVHQDD